MKIFRVLTFSIVCSILASCDNIGFEDRFDGPILTEAGKNVLIEEYTGQKCSNCPLAHEEIGNLQEAFGQDRVIAVALHGGPQAVDSDNSKFQGLANEESREYNRRLGSFSYPKGIVDRISGLKDYEKWSSFVVSRFSVQAKIKLDLNDIYVDEASRQLSFKCDVESSANADGFLQLWLTESNITTIQALPALWGGGYQEDYVHNHVFRATVNGMDGERMGLTGNQKITREYAFRLDDGWKPQNMALVAFFYNGRDGVMQVIDAPLLPQNESNQSH